METDEIKSLTIKPEYETDRLVLKILDTSYAGAVAEYFLRNRDFLEQWEPAWNGQFATPEFQEKQLEQELSRLEQGASVKFWIFKKRTARLIGSVSFNNIIRGPFQSCFIGYRLDKEEINCGLMTEALRRAVKIAFQDLKLHRLEANIMPVNGRSLRVAEKCGFQNEGTGRKYLQINGKWEDHIHMVLLDEKG